jgi:hypothetical protein
LWTGFIETVHGSTTNQIDQCRWIKIGRPDFYEIGEVRALLVLATQD